MLFRSHLTDDLDEHLLLSTLRHDDWSNGESVAAFEQQFATFCGCKFALLVVNCTAAIKLALLGAGIKPGDEVLVPGLTWPSVAIAVMECGAEPVPVDVDPATYCLSVETIEPALSSRTRGIIPTHLFCSQVDMPPLLELAAAKNLVVIEDAAHSVGAMRYGKVTGTFGIAGCFSFNQKKLLACGEGGCLITNDESLYRTARALREVDPEAVVPPSHLPGTLMVSEFQASILSTQLAKLPTQLRVVEQSAEQLRSLLEEDDRVRVLNRLSATDLQTFYGFCFRVEGITDIFGFRHELG